VTRLAAWAGDLAGAVRGRPLPLNRWRYRELYAEGFACSVDRLRERLGVVAQIGLSEGLARTAAWYREERWL
jgi:nucleoside-diphosphate-sugar epimerase